jgi:hypothetical protein
MSHLDKMDCIEDDAINVRNFENKEYRRGKDTKSSEMMLAEMMQYKEAQGICTKRERVSQSVEIDAGYGLGKMKVSRWSLENQEKEARQDKEEQNRREAERLVAKRVLEHETECAHCKDHVLKATVRISTEVDHFGKLVKKRRLEGSHQTCHNCPISMHTQCRALPMYSQHQGCPQHRCHLCQKGATDAGGLLFRCTDCLTALCFLCMEGNEMTELVDYLDDHPTWPRTKGYVAPTTVRYMRCPNCATSASAVKAKEAFREEATKYILPEDEEATSAGTGISPSAISSSPDVEATIQSSPDRQTQKAEI